MADVDDAHAAAIDAEQGNLREVDPTVVGLDPLVTWSHPRAPS